MAEIEQRARELLAAEYAMAGSTKRADKIIAGFDCAPGTEYALRAIAAALRAAPKGIDARLCQALADQWQRDANWFPSPITARHCAGKLQVLINERYVVTDVDDALYQKLFNSLSRFRCAVKIGADHCRGFLGNRSAANQLDELLRIIDDTPTDLRTKLGDA